MTEITIICHRWTITCQQDYFGKAGFVDYFNVTDEWEVRMNIELIKEKKTTFSLTNCFVRRSLLSAATILGGDNKEPVDAVLATANKFADEKVLSS